MVDSGSAIGIVSQSCTSDRINYNKVESALRTVTGTVTVEEGGQTNCREVDAHLTPVVAPRVPRVIPLLRLCMEDGCGRTRDPGQEPELIAPNGTRRPLRIVDNVPFLVTPELGFSRPSATIVQTD